MKPGIKTTEFWLTLAAVGLSAALATGLIPAGEWERAASAVGMVLAAFGYGAQRANVKRADAPRQEG